MDALIGQSARFEITWKNLSGDIADPSTVTFAYNINGGPVTRLVFGTAIEVLKTAIGKYRVDLSLNTAGSWWWRWEATGTVTDAVEDTLPVRRSRVTAR